MHRRVREVVARQTLGRPVDTLVCPGGARQARTTVWSREGSIAYTISGPATGVVGNGITRTFQARRGPRAVGVSVGQAHVAFLPDEEFRVNRRNSVGNDIVAHDSFVKTRRASLAVKPVTNVASVAFALKRAQGIVTHPVLRACPHLTHSVSSHADRLVAFVDVIAPHAGGVGARVNPVAFVARVASADKGARRKHKVDLALSVGVAIVAFGLAAFFVAEIVLVIAMCAIARVPDEAVALK